MGLEIFSHSGISAGMCHITSPHAISSIKADRNFDAANSANCCIKAYGGVSSAASTPLMLHKYWVKRLKIAVELDLPLGTRKKAERGRRT